MPKRIPVIASYIALIAISLLVAMLHETLISRAVAWMHPARAVPTGVFAPLPLQLLHLVGNLSWLIPGILLLLLAASFRRETLARFSTICTVALCQGAYLTLYAASTIVLLAFAWLAATNHLR